MTSSHPVLRPASRARDPVVAAVPVFYGWVMLAIAVAGMICTSPGQTFGISSFNPSLLAALGLSEAALSGAYMLGTLAAAPLVSLVGTLMDRYGIRRVMMIVVLLFGGACLATSQVTGMVTLLAAFFSLRLLGQGALTLLSSNTLAMWFHDRLGTASGLMSLGTAGAFAIVPPLNLLLIDRFGWRWAYALLGLIVWLVMLPLLAIFYRNRPEDVGQSPDGGQAEKSLPPHEGEDALHQSLTLPQAVASRAYWILLCMNACWALVGTGIVFHIVSLFGSHGLSRATASLFFPCFAASMAAAQFLGGLLADRVRINTLLFVSMVGTTLAVAYLNYLEGAASVVVYAVGQGASQGLFMVLMQTVWARYFGRVHLGKIRGTVWTATVAGSAVGPPIMGVAKDYLGSFAPAIWLFVVLYGILALAAVFVTPPRREALV